MPDACGEFFEANFCGLNQIEINFGSIEFGVMQDIGDFYILIRILDNFHGAETTRVNTKTFILPVIILGREFEGIWNRFGART